MYLPEPMRLFRRSQLVRMAVATGAGLGSLVIPVATANAQIQYQWTAVTNGGGDWATGSNWAGGVAPVSSQDNQIQFNLDGNYLSAPDISPNNGLFNLNNISVAVPTSTSTITLGYTAAISTTVNTLNFIPDSSGDNPALNVSNGTLLVQNAVVFAPNSNISVSGSGNLTLGSGGQGSQNFGSGSLITNSGSGQLIIGAVGQGGVSFGDNVVISNTGSGLVQLTDFYSATTNYNSTGTGILTLNNSGPGIFTIGNLNEGIKGVLNIAGGLVSFSGNTSGNLFGNNLVLNVLAGATFNYANNPETQGGIEGAGNIIMGTAGITVTLAGNRSFTGAISGTGGFAQDVTNGILTFGGSNTYTGTTTVEAIGGQLIATAPNTLSPNSYVNVTAGGTLGLGGFNQSIAGLNGGNFNGSLSLGTSTLSINNSAGTLRVWNSPLTGTGNVILTGGGAQALLGVNTYTGSTNVASGTLVANYAGLINSSSILVPTGSTLQVIVDTPATNALNLNISGGLVKVGNGTLTLNTSNANFNPSSVGVEGGALVLDHTANNGSEVGSAAALIMGSGTLSLLGNASAISSETFTGTTLQGAGTISVTSNGQNAAINTGAITRAPATGATVNFVSTNAGSGVATITTTTPNGAFNTLGGFAVFNGSDWAVTGTGSGPFNVAPLSPSSYTANSFGQTSSGIIVHTNVTASFTAKTNSYTSDVRFNSSAGAYVLTLSGADSIVDGGILVTPNVGTNTPTIAGSSTNTLTAPAGQDLIINQFDTKAPLNISAGIINAPGTATVTQTPVSIASGASQTITLGSPDTVANLNLSLGELVTTNAGTGGNLNASANATIVALNPALNQITVASTGANITTSSGNTLTFTPGTNLVKSGAGQLKLVAANSFKGLLVLNQGTTTVTSASYLGSTSSGSSTIYFNGGTLEAGVSVSGTEGINDWIVGPGGATIQVDSGFTYTKYGNSLWGSGDITLTGAGTFGVGSDGSSFNGRIFVNNGIFRLTSNQVASATGITVASGAQYLLDDTASGPFNIAPGASLVLNGNGPGVAGSYGGAWEHENDSGEAGASASYAFNSSVILQTTSRFNEVPGINTSGTFITVNDIFPYPITGPGNLIKDGQGSLVLSNANNTYGGGTTGTTIISNGTLQLGVTKGVPAGSTLQFGEAGIGNSGIFDLNSFNQTVQNLTVATNTGTSQQIVNSSNASSPSVLTLNYNGSSAGNFPGSIGNGASQNNITLVSAGTSTFILSGINTYTGGTNVSAGSLVIAAAGALPTSTNLIIAAGASLKTSSLRTLFDIGSLNNSGVLDLNNNDLVIENGTLAAVTAQVQTGYNGGNWNGTTGITSTAASQDSTHLTALGAIVNDNGSGAPLYGSGGTLGSTFEGATPADAAILIKYTYYGDTDLNGEVDGTDYTRIDASFLAEKTSPTPLSISGWYNGDFNYDGVVNGSDYTLIDNAFNSQGAAISAQVAAQVAGGSAVPEPASIGLIVMGAIALLGRRSAKR